MSVYFSRAVMGSKISHSFSDLFIHKQNVLQIQAYDNTACLLLLLIQFQNTIRLRF